MAEPSSGAAAYELPSFLDIFGVDMHRHLLGLSLHEWMPIIMSLLVGIFLVGISLISTRNLKKLPDGMQGFMEIIIEWFENFFGSIMGSIAPRYEKDTYKQRHDKR